MTAYFHQPSSSHPRIVHDSTYMREWLAFYGVKKIERKSRARKGAWRKGTATLVRPHLPLLQDYYDRDGRRRWVEET